MTYQRRYEQKQLHLTEPNFLREKFQLPRETEIRIFDRLSYLYSDVTADSYFPELLRVMQVYYAYKTDRMIEQDKFYDELERFNQEDIILIAYGDIIKDENESSLITLSKFFGKYLEGVINTLHILPFFPYTSDRGFSVIDFESVDPSLGTWEDVADLEKRYNLMFDGVINHVSSKSRWFLEFLNQNPEYEDFFVSFKSYDELTEADRKLIFRPRTSDILTPYETLNGKRYVWTTFSNDQIDLNYKNPKVLLKVIEILLTYVRRGADILRLDAITYLWTEVGTSCVSLRQTHEVVKLLRDIIGAVAPHVTLITETNVPHQENISYFGNGHDEAHMVYNFSLPPLVLYSFYEENTFILSDWLENLEYKGETAHYFNFLDSHDGIGLMGARGILSDEQIDAIVATAVTKHGAFVSSKARREGGERPYEINSTWFSAIVEEKSNFNIDLQVKKFLASRSIAISIKGVPGIYFHSLLGTKNDIDAVYLTNKKRDINRKVVWYKALVEEFSNEQALIHKLNTSQMQLLKKRISQRAFHPRSAQKILKISPKLFSIVRITPENDEVILCLTNVSHSSFSIAIERELLPSHSTLWQDILNDKEYKIKDQQLEVYFTAYDIIWLKATKS